MAVRNLSIGMPSTLKSYLSLCIAFFGAESEPTKYIQGLIEEQGEDMEVVADEGQMILLLTSMVE